VIASSWNDFVSKSSGKNPISIFDDLELNREKAFWVDKGKNEREMRKAEMTKAAGESRGREQTRREDLAGVRLFKAKQAVLASAEKAKVLEGRKEELELERKRKKNAAEAARTERENAVAKTKKAEEELVDKKLEQKNLLMQNNNDFIEKDGLEKAAKLAKDIAAQKAKDFLHEINAKNEEIARRNAVLAKVARDTAHAEKKYQAEQANIAKKERQQSELRQTLLAAKEEKRLAEKAQREKSEAAAAAQATALAEQERIALLVVTAKARSKSATDQRKKYENILQEEKSAIQGSEDLLKETTLPESSKGSLEQKISESKVGVSEMENMLVTLKGIEEQAETDLLNVATMSEAAITDWETKEASSFSI
jgi:hypothetical protein